MDQKPLRWAIVATGNISLKFAKVNEPASARMCGTNLTQDLLVDPATRDANDVKHVLAAVGSRSAESAGNFLEKLKGDEETDKGKLEELDRCKRYGTYDEIYSDPVSTLTMISILPPYADRWTGCRCCIHRDTPYLSSFGSEEGARSWEIGPLRKAIHDEREGAG